MSSGTTLVLLSCDHADAHAAHDDRCAAVHVAHDDRCAVLDAASSRLSGPQHLTPLAAWGLPRGHRPVLEKKEPFDARSLQMIHSCSELPDLVTTSLVFNPVNIKAVI